MTRLHDVQVMSEICDALQSRRIDAVDVNILEELDLQQLATRRHLHPSSLEFQNLSKKRPTTEEVSERTSTAVRPQVWWLHS